MFPFHCKTAKCCDHGAKNSTRTRGPLVIASKLLGVTSITSEGSSATARVTRARAVRERRREENFMTDRGRVGLTNKVCLRLIWGRSPAPDEDVAVCTWSRPAHGSLSNHRSAPPGQRLGVPRQQMKPKIFQRFSYNLYALQTKAALNQTYCPSASLQHTFSHRG